MQDLDPVARGRAHRSTSSSTAARTVASSTSRPTCGAPGRSSRTKPTPASVRFLSRAERREHLVDGDGGVEARRQPVASQDLANLGAQLVGAREPQRREQAEPDGLAVAVPRVPARRLDRMPDGVAEVEDRAAAGVALVVGDDLDLRPRAGEDDVVEAARIEALDRADPLPERAARDQRGLQHLDEPRAQLASGRVVSVAGVGEHRRRQVVGADVVLRLRQVHPGLAAVGRVDLGDQVVGTWTTGTPRW